MRLIRFLERDWRNLYVDAVARREENRAAAQARDKMAHALAKEMDAELEQGECANGGKPSQEWTDEAEFQFSQGNHSAALKELLCNGGVLRKDLDESVAKIIEEKLKRPPLPSQQLVEGLMADLRAKAQSAIELTVADAKVSVRLNRHKSSGFSGHRAMHLVDALKCESERVELWDTFTRVLNVICVGHMPAQLVPYMHGGRGNIAGKARLFVAMEFIVRIAESSAARVELARQQREGRRLFKWNIGVGLPGAADILKQWATTTSEGNSDIDDLALVEADAHNMFLEVNRERILRVVFQRCPRLFYLVRYYTKPQFVSFFKGFLLRDFSGGVPIGAGLGSLLASLVAEDLLDELMHSSVKDEIIELRAYIDNVFIFAKAQNVSLVLVKLMDLARRSERHGANDDSGLRFSYRKAHPHQIHFPFGRNISRSLEAWQTHFKGWRVSVADHEDLQPEFQGLVLAGVPFGSQSFYQHLVRHKIEKAKAIMGVLGNGRVPPLPAVVLLKSCVISKLDFMRRTVTLDEGVRDTIYGVFDNLVIQTLEGIAGAHAWQNNAAVRIQLQLPPRFGGQGFRAMVGPSVAMMVVFKLDPSTPKPLRIRWMRITVHS